MILISIYLSGDDYNGLLKLYDAYKGREPNLDFNALSEPSWQSREAFKLLYKLLKGEAVDKNVAIMPEPINSSNYTQFMKANMPDTLFADNDLPPEVLANLIQ